MERVATLRLSLIRSLKDDEMCGFDYQLELKRFFSLIRASGIRMNAVALTVAGTVIDSGFTGEFVVPLAQPIGPVLGRAACAWLQGCAGRTVRLAIGNLEFNVGAPDDLDALIRRFATRTSTAGNDNT
jgi:hypothetical protein